MKTKNDNQTTGESSLDGAACSASLSRCGVCGYPKGMRHTPHCRAKKTEGDIVGGTADWLIRKIVKRPTKIITDPSKIREICEKPYLGSRENAIRSIISQNAKEHAPPLAGVHTETEN